MNDLIQQAIIALFTLVLIPLIIPPLLRLLASLPEPWRGIVRGFLDALKNASQTATTQAAEKAVLAAEQIVKPHAVTDPAEHATRNHRAYELATRVLRRDRAIADSEALQVEIEAALARVKNRGEIQ